MRSCSCTTLMPHKPIGELYTVLGRAKQGKTERYRALFRHLATHPDERLVRADGARGMVMAVFTPIAYPVVFKVIRDQFAYPKDSARRTVEEKYRLVFRYDRIGRLVDAQEFRYLRFPLRQIDPDLLRRAARANAPKPSRSTARICWSGIATSSGACVR